MNDIIFFTIVYFNVHKLNLKNFFIITGISFAIIIYQVTKIVLDEDKIQKDKNNVYYITTRFIIDVPIRFILKDFVESPFEEIYFFSILDITLIGYVIHYCEYTYHLSKIYLIISFYGTIIGLIINLFLFYGFKFCPPMSLIPLFISIVSLIIYSIYKKQFFDFMELEKDEGQDFQDMVEIQEIKDNQNPPIEMDKKDEFNISFKDNQIFQEEVDALKNQDQKKENENDDDSDDEKKHAAILNKFSSQINFSNKFSSNLLDLRLSSEENEGNEANKQLINSMGKLMEIKENDKNNSENKDKKRNKYLNLPSPKKYLQRNDSIDLEMKILENNDDENKENEDKKDKGENQNNKEN